MLPIRNIRNNEILTKLTRFLPSLRAIAAFWRQLNKIILILLGLGCFVAFQLFSAKLIVNQNFLMLAIVVLAPIAVIVAFYSPATIFGLWLMLSPFLGAILTKGLFTFDTTVLLVLFAFTCIKALHNKVKLVKFDYPMILLAAAYVYFWLRGGIYDNWTLHDYVFGIWGFQAFPIVVYFIAKNAISSKRDISIVFGFIVLLGFLWVIVLSYEHFTGNRFIPSLMGYSVELKRQGVGGQGRVQGVSESESLPGLILCFAMLACTHCALFARSRSVKSICALLMAAIPVVVFWTYTKNSYVSFFILLVTMTILAKPQRKIYNWILAVALIIISVSFLCMSLSNNLDALARPENIFGRMAMNKAAINMIKDKPIFGVGNAAMEVHNYIADYKNHPTYKRIGGVQYGLPANDFLLVFAQYGLVGFLLLYGGILLAFRRLYAVRTMFADNNFYSSHMINIALCYVIVFFVANMTRESQTSYYIPYCMLVYLGIAARLSGGLHSSNNSSMLLSEVTER